MKIHRWAGVMALWVAVGAAVVWCETQDLRTGQLVSQLHHQKRLLLEQRAQLLVAVNRRTSPAQLISTIERLNIGLLPAGQTEPDKPPQAPGRATRRGASR